MNKEELKALSEQILTYRAKHNLSGAMFCKKCNITLQTLYAIENCKQNPSKMTLRKILNVIEQGG